MIYHVFVLTDEKFRCLKNQFSFSLKQKGNKKINPLTLLIHCLAKEVMISDMKSFRRN